MRPLQQSFLREKPIRGRFFLKSEISSLSLEKHWILLNMRRRAKMYGSQDPLQLRRLQVSPDRLSLAETPRCATVHLSAARLLLVKAQLWEIPQSLRTQCCLTRFRFLIIIMLEMQCWDISPIWAPDRSVLT